MHQITPIFLKNSEIYRLTTSDTQCELSAAFSSVKKLTGEYIILYNIPYKIKKIKKCDINVFLHNIAWPPLWRTGPP